MLIKDHQEKLRCTTFFDTANLCHYKSLNHQNIKISSVK